MSAVPPAQPQTQPLHQQPVPQQQQPQSHQPQPQAQQVTQPQHVSQPPPPQQQQQQQQQQQTQQPGQPPNIIAALGNAFKTSNGDPLSGEHIAQLLIANMSQLGELAKQGKLSQQQIVQLKQYADKHKAANSASTSTTTQAPQPASVPVAANPAFKHQTQAPFLSANPTVPAPISSTLSSTPQTPVQWQPAQQGRPSLTGGIPSGRVSGAPPQVAKPQDDTTVLTLDDNRSRRKSTPGDQSMRRSIQDLVSSIDPNVKIEPEVEDLLLDIADEFIDSVTNFGCRLAKHRGGDTLEVKDLQLHLERNHNIRIPGFASDEARISLSQAAIAPAAATAGTTKKGTQNAQMTLRSHRLSQVQFAKKEAKLM
ncbi:transcription initiation factor TFIID subunit A-domain-containing protein [Trametes meyenii]|nr:transcription initiation factor TFIID subunit A-domain-containing protein [Trametes meyenii]